MSAQSLAGLRIVELSSYVATPLCGLSLRQLGAEVIRVEPLDGAPDRTRMPRSTDGTSLYWSGLNSGKQDLAVDLQSDEGRRLVADLICGSGPEADPGGAIVVTNNERYPDFSFETLSQRRPDLVHVVLNGTHEGGNAVDYTVQATTGFATITGPENYSVPTNTVVPAWDIAAGLYLAIGVLAAVHERQRTGRGQQVRVALEDVALSSAGVLGYLAEAQLMGIDRVPSGNDVFGTYGNDFLTADGVRFMLVVLTKGHWRKLVKLTGLEDTISAIEKSLGTDLDEEAERYRHRRVIDSLLEAWFSHRDWDDVQRGLSQTRVLAAPYLSFDDLVADDAALLRSNPLFAELDQPGVGTYLAPRGPLSMSGSRAEVTPAPQVGEHNDSVLSQLGLSDDRIAELRSSGTIR